MARPIVIIAVTVFAPDGAIFRKEELGRELMEGESGLSTCVTFSKRDKWVKFSNGEREWFACGLPFVIDSEELP